MRCLQDEKNRNTLGKKGTFVVHVHYLEKSTTQAENDTAQKKQNSTWQGEIVWAEKNESLKFRSALELLKIMDSALATTEQGEKKGEKL